MGAVYEAQQLGLDRKVAIKVLHLNLLQDAESFARFEREALVLSTLHHRNLPIFYEYGIWQKALPFIAMEFLEGESLRKVIDTEFETTNFSAGRIDRLLGILLQAADAMSFVHKEKILHRDLKPSNILVTKDSVKVLDFGLAKIVAKDSAAFQKLTQTGMLMGTAQYLSPELCRGEPADERSDIYSFGCILYECITGMPPHTADNPIGLMNKHVNETAIPPSQCAGAALTPRIDEIVLKALAKLPAERYQNIDDLRADLSEVKRDFATRTSLFTPAQAPAGKSVAIKKLPIRAALLSASAVLLAAISGSHFFGAQQHKQVQVPALNENEVLTDSKARTIIASAKRRYEDEKTRAHALSELNSIVEGKISNNAGLHKLEAMGFLLTKGEGEQNVLFQKITELCRKIVKDKRSSPKSLQQVSETLTAAIFKLHEDNADEKSLLCLQLYDACRDRMSKAGETFPMNVVFEVARREIYLGANQQPLLEKADERVNRMLMDPDTTQADRKDLCTILLIDSLMLKKGKPEIDKAFNRLLESIKNYQTTDDKGLLPTSILMTIVARCPHSQVIELLNALLEKLENFSDPMLKGIELRAILTASIPLWSSPGYKACLDRMYSEVDDKVLNWKSFREFDLLNFARAYCAERDYKTAEKIIKRIKIGSAELPPESQISWIEVFSQIALSNKQAINQIDKHELERLAQEYLLAIDISAELAGKEFRTEGEVVRTQPFSSLLEKRTGASSAAAFKKGLRDVLKKRKLYDQLTKQTELILLIIPGEYPNSIEQAEFKELALLAADSALEPELRCNALTAMADTYNKVGDKRNQIKCLDEALLIDAPDSGIKRWALFHRGGLYEKEAKYAEAEKLMWRAMMGLKGPQDKLDRFAYNHFSNALINHYRLSGDASMASKLQDTRASAEKFWELCPKTLTQ